MVTYLGSSYALFAGKARKPRGSVCTDFSLKGHEEQTMRQTRPSEPVWGR